MKVCMDLFFSFDSHEITAHVKENFCVLPGPCASIEISQVGWGCGVPSTETIYVECSVSGGCFPKVSCQLQSSLWDGKEPLRISSPCPSRPRDSHVLCSCPRATWLVPWAQQSFRTSTTWEGARLQAKVPFPCLEYAESLRKPEGKVFCQLLTDLVEGAGQQETTCGFLHMHPPSNLLWSSALSSGEKSLSALSCWSGASLPLHPSWAAASCCGCYSRDRSPWKSSLNYIKCGR